MKNSVSGSWVAASVDATLRAGVCTAASRSSGGVGREHIGQKTSCVEGGTKVPERSCRWIHLRENSASGIWVETSCETAMCGIVCVAASRNRVRAAVKLVRGCNAPRIKHMRVAWQPQRVWLTLRHL